MRLKSFVDWADRTASESIEEGADDMFSLTTGFTARIHKRAVSS